MSRGDFKSSSSFGVVVKEERVPLLLLSFSTFDNSISHSRDLTFRVFFRLLQQWELLVLSRLKWDMCAVTPHDFVDLLLTRLDLATAPVPDVNNRWDATRRTAHGFIALCALEHKFTTCSPSMIACACLTAALRGEQLESSVEDDTNEIFTQLQAITQIEAVSCISFPSRVNALGLLKLKMYF